MRAQVRAHPKIFWGGKESMCAPARKIFGVRATMRALWSNFKIERFFKIRTFFKNPNRQSAPKRCEVDQLQKFFHKMIIFHLNSVRAKLHLLTPNSHEVREGGGRYFARFHATFPFGPARQNQIQFTKSF